MRKLFQDRFKSAKRAYSAIFPVSLSVSELLLLFETKIEDMASSHSCAHTNRFCVVQENIKPEVLKVQTELASKHGITILVIVLNLRPPPAIVNLIFGHCKHWASRHIMLTTFLQAIFIKVFTDI